MNDKHSHAPLALFLLATTLGLWIGAFVLRSSRTAGWIVLLDGIAVGAVLYVLRKGTGIRAAAAGFLPDFWRAVVDAPRSIVRSLAKPYGSGWGFFFKTLGVIAFVICLFFAYNCFHDAVDTEYEYKHLLFLTKGFEFLFGGLQSILILWAIGSLYSSVVITKENLARIRHAETFKENSALAASLPVPDGGEPPSLKTWSVLCMAMGFLGIVFFLGGSMVALASGGQRILGIIGIPLAFVVFFFWKTWADILRAQTAAATDARECERKAVVDVPDAFSVARSGNPEHRAESASEIAATPSPGGKVRVRWASAFVCMALVVAGLFGAVRFRYVLRVLQIEEWFAERDRIVRMEREERDAAQRKAKEEARTWKGKTKIVPVSESVAIKLRSVPGNLWFGQYEVTQAQWETVMGDNPSKYKDPDNPVETVSWDDCQEFLEELNAIPSVKKTGLVFRLPTDAEWEAACRAGATGDYCLMADGTEITEGTLGEVAWFGSNSDGKTHPVGQKKPNAFGLYDIHGNVWEWTSTAVGEVRILRGGGWFDSAWGCESSDRVRFSASRRFGNLGFRLCADGGAD